MISYAFLFCAVLDKIMFYTTTFHEIAVTIFGLGK